jgi:hypothetical protein
MRIRCPLLAYVDEEGEDEDESKKDDEVDNESSYESDDSD